jgi:hypothetical protein
LGTITHCDAADMIGKRIKMSQYTCFVVCVVAEQFIRRLHYGLEILKLAFVVVVGKRFHDGLLLMQHRNLKTGRDAPGK